MNKIDIKLSNVIDKYKKYEKTGITTSTNFLNEEMFIKTCKFLDSRKIKYNVYLPYEFLEKRIIYFGKKEDFISFYKAKIPSNITHSNVLGALFSLGFTNEIIGDIFIEDGYFYLTNLKRMDYFLETNFTNINNSTICLERVNEIVLLKEHVFKYNISVSSLRLDNVVSKVINTSRSKVSELFKERYILLNYEEVSPRTIIKEGDILSIRKNGKYRILKFIGMTKKEKIIIEIAKYI